MRFYEGMKSPFAAAILLLLLVLNATGQPETLTNSHIIEMARAGLSTQIILRKIGTANPKFDVSASALIELKKAQVPDDVITAMIDRQTEAVTEPGSNTTAAFSESGTPTNEQTQSSGPPPSSKEMLARAKTIAFVKSSLHPSRQALEKELMKRADFRDTKLTIIRYREHADLFVEIGYVSLSWLTHRYVYRIYDRRSGTVLAAGETTSWGSLAENLARNISRSLAKIGA